MLRWADELYQIYERFVDSPLTEIPQFCCQCHIPQQMHRLK